MQRFRGAFAEAILEVVTDHVEKVPCVALVADKVTVDKRTIDITGIITLLSDAPHDCMVQSYVVGAPIVRKQNKMARDWQKSGWKL